jgi:small subunit ribosomal protein S24e
MDIEISSRKENGLLKRAELEITVKHQNSPTPKRDEVKDAVAKSLGIAKDGLVIVSMKSSFGSHETHVLAMAYADKETALKTENKHILVRNRLAEKTEKVKAAKKPAAK